MKQEQAQAGAGQRPPLHVGDLPLVGLALLVALAGALSALAVRLFEAAVDGLFTFGFHWFPEWLLAGGLPGWAAVLIYPFCLGLLVVAAKRWVPPEDRLHSIPLVMVALFKRGGLIRLWTTLVKTLGPILMLGAGGSLGREGPVVLLGGGVGSAIGQAFRLREEWLRTLVAAGAAAAIATAFHAPITGAFFAMEILLLQFSSRSFALLALASVTAAQVSNLLAGTPQFPIPAYGLNSTWEIPLYLGLGLLITPIARVYIRVLYGSERLGQKITWIPGWLKPAVGGLLFGGVAIFLPRTLGGGHETISAAMAGQLSLGMLVALLAAKFLTIGLTSGSGWPGGVFTPAMFLGAMAGGSYGAIAALLFPGLVTQPSAYAVVGMAAMISGATQAPLTAMTLIFEVTRDYRIALPAMLACGIAAVFSQRFSPYSVDTLHLPEQGVLLPWQVHDLRSIPVADAMTEPVHTVKTGMRLREVIGLMQHYKHGGYPVVDEAGSLVGMITLGDVRSVPLAERMEKPVEAVMVRRLAVITPEQTLAEAALIMARRGVGRLPVVAAEEPTRLLGIISRTDLLRAYPDEKAPQEAPELFLER